MVLSSAYPKLNQWLSYGGQMWVRPAAGGTVEVLLGDCGGFPQDTPASGKTVDGAFSEAERHAENFLRESRRLQQILLTDDVPDLRNEEFIRVPGLPPVSNPHYRP